MVVASSDYSDSHIYFASRIVIPSGKSLSFLSCQLLNKAANRLFHGMIEFTFQGYIFGIKRKECLFLYNFLAA